MIRVARSFHAATAAVATCALLLQLGLVIDGASVLAEGAQPGLWLRVGRYFCYFTIQSNILVAVATAWLVVDPKAGSTVFRALWLAGVIGIAITGVVHFLLLRPLLDLHGWNQVADTLLHILVPIMAVVGWAAFGPRGRVDRRTVGFAFCWPALWLAWTLVLGAGTRWFPYPFLNWRHAGGGAVVVTCLGIFAFTAALFAAASWLDARLPGSGEV